MQGVSGIGTGFLAQLFPAAVLPASASGGSLIPLRPPTIPAERVLVTTAHDRMDCVLDKFNVPHRPVIDRLRISDAALAGASYLFVGCGQKLSDRSPARIAEWVRSGGCLMTSDWMSFHLLDAFVDDGGRPIVSRQPVITEESSLVEITKTVPFDPTLNVLSDTLYPGFWKVSNCSYPMGAIDKSRVTVLASASDLGRKFGEAGAALFLRFPYGLGQVVHVLSHWSEQHFETPPPDHSPTDRPPHSRTMIFDVVPNPLKC
ncbi:MAG TPA: hypothetical protein VFX30_06165 [bacterium]|nr:hypothetical protein [bacterium]